MINLNYSTWSTQGTDGVWLGIGFGQQQMAGSDIVMCQFLFSGTTANDNFICSDRYATGDSMPSLDTTNDIVTTGTTRSYNTTSTLANLTVTFTRKFNTGNNVGEEFIITDGATINAIWAWGAVYSSTM